MPRSARFAGLAAAFATLAAQATEPFELLRDGGGHVVNIRLHGRPVVTCVGGPGAPPAGVPEAYRRGGYLHPLVTPAGRVVTGDYPANHRHHHGVWTAWTKTEFDGRAPDFWNMGQRRGRVEFVELLHARADATGADLGARHRFVDLTAPAPVTVLEETWRLRVHPTPPDAPHVLDLDITQRNVTDRPLRLPKYHYGGLGFRGPDAWDGAANAIFLTSAGVTNRLNGNETSGRWCWIGGLVDGAPAGVALLGHPDNFRAPQPMRLHPTEPFFCFAPQQGGDFTIAPGEIHRARYRLIVADGPPDRAELDRRWADYAAGR
jgi:hypothetical protein